MVGLTYDAGALVAAEKRNARMWAIHRRALDRGVVPRVPAAVVTQVWRGRGQHDLVRFLVGCHVVPLDRDAAEAAGCLLRPGGDDAVDATVVAAAKENGGSVVTSDRGDIERIAAANGIRLNIEDV